MRRHIAFLIVVLATAGAAAGQERIGTGPAATDPANAAEEKAIDKVRAAYVKAFNAGDARALTAFWTPDGEFVDAEGHSFRGRNAIEKEFAAFLGESKGVTLEISPDSVRFVSPGVALESGTSRVTRSSDGATNTAGYNIVHVKKDGQWQMASVRELPYTAPSNYDHLRDLEWLVGNWAAKGSAGQSLELSCEWTAKRNFLTRRYTAKGADGTVRTGMQIIGWDPVLGGVRSWVFDSDGGFGSERWVKDGKRWVLEASGVTRDGGQVAATNIVARQDADSFTWQSVQRSLNQVRLPDTAVLTVTRVKARKENTGVRP
jgi:uncharacterized protein (TIGR02246 family)